MRRPIDRKVVWGFFGVQMLFIVIVVFFCLPFALYCVQGFI